MKKIISMLLVLAMMITVLTVGMATTSAADTATITIYGLDGTTEVKEFNVGDEFTVYTTLNVSGSVANGLVGSVQGTQTYSSDVLELADEVDKNYGEFTDLAKVFPVTATATMSNGSVAGKITYNASAVSESNAFKFDKDSSLLIVTTYKVSAAGNGEVKNALRNLAAADATVTRIVYEGTVQEGKSIAGIATYDDPTPTIDHAEVRVHSLDGTVETKSFQIGETFKVYTTLNASSVNEGRMASVNGVQKFTSSMLQLQDEVTQDGDFSNKTEVFPIMGTNAIANTKTAGTIKYSGSSTGGFLFSSDNSRLITTTYKVTANGYADITNKLNVLAAADEDITRIVFNGEVQSGTSYNMPASFYEPGTAPTDPPQPPTQAPTNGPTQAPVTEGPTEAPAQKLKVTIINPDNSTEVKEFAVGAEFTVYTVLNAGASIACVDGTQTYTTAKLQLTDAVNGEYNEITNKTDMFPIIGSEVTAAVNDGAIQFNATRGGIGEGYAFNTAASKLIVTNYKVLATGEATIKTTLKTLIKDDEETTKIVWLGETQDGQSYSMPGSFTDPTAPTEAPTQAPTQAPPTQAPTQKPTDAPANKAVVTIYGIDGTTQVKEFNVGDTFTVYTTLNVSESTEDGKIGNIGASQTYTTSILQNTNEVDAIGVPTAAERNKMFPILLGNATARIAEGAIRYNATTPYVGEGWLFNTDDSLLLVSTYEVIATGNAEVRNVLTSLAADDLAMTRLVNKGEVQPGVVLEGIASFTDPTAPTEAPTQAPPTQAPTQAPPTQAPTQAPPTQAPTQAPPTQAPTQAPPTQAPTQAPPTQAPTDPPAQKAIVTIYGIDGTTEVKEIAVGESFTVYTTFNAGGRVSNISATQTFTTGILQNTDAVTGEGVVIDTTAMFPITKDSSLARVTDGKIEYNASNPAIGEGFLFDSDTDVLIATNYTVLAAGNAEVRNAIVNVTADNEDLSRIVKNGEVQPGYEIGGIASFTDPTQPDVPTDAPTQPVVPTEAPTQPSGRTVLLGDFDGDEDVSALDATTMQRAIAGMKLPSYVAQDKLAGDVNFDESVDMLDVTIILRFLADMNVKYPIDQEVVREEVEIDM